MAAQQAILAVDQGTTNTKVVLLGASGDVLASGSAPIDRAFPEPGWVQQDAAQIWESVQIAIGACLEAAEPVDLVGIGISNQRESVLAWDRSSGAPLGPVITWQCRRTAAACTALRQDGHEGQVIAKTGLPIDPLFPASKARWLLDNPAAGQDPAKVCLGTVDAWLIWNFTGGAVHATDASNAARTQLYAIGEGRWDDELCALFGVQQQMLPEVRDSAHVFGHTKGVRGLADGIPIGSAIGDSHGALFGHGAFAAGDGKVTFGTGSSVMTTIPKFIVPPKGLTTTIAWSIGGRPTYAFEGNILTSASILPWTAELLGVESVDALLELAQTVDTTLGVYLVPAHVGLGSPHWDAEARGLVSGLTFGANRAEVARAAAESLALQVNDVFEIVSAHAGQEIGHLFVDGGPSRNRFLMSMAADLLNHPVTTCTSPDASARGAGYLAGIAVGLWPDQASVGRLAAQGHGERLAPTLDPKRRVDIVGGWRQAVQRACFHAP